MTGLHEALAAVPSFRDLDETGVAALAEQCAVRDHAPGAVVLSQGEPCAGLGIVVHGQVRLLRSSPAGREQVLRIVGPGRSFNDIAATDGGPNAASVIAGLASRVALLPRAALLRLLDERPDVARTMIELAARRERGALETVEDAALHSVSGRVARLLLRCATRDQQLIDGAPDACAHITQQDIAALTGSVREVVQRALKDLEQAGAIRLGRADVSILDTSILETRALD